MPKVPETININEKAISFRQVYRDFSNSGYGMELRNNVRYGRYKPEGMENDEWEKIMGADVNNLKHLKLTYVFGKQFIRHCIDPEIKWRKEKTQAATFTPEEQSYLLLAGIVHDWGEAVWGDIILDNKTSADEKNEFEAIEQIFKDIYGEELGVERNNDFKITLEKVLKDKESKLGKAFNAIENLGYIRTGLKAWKRIDIRPDLTQRLQWLTGNVLLNQIPVLIKYSDEYPIIDKYLCHYQDLITDIFNKMPSSAFDLYPDKRELFVERFEKAKSEWREKWLNKQK